MKKILAVDDEPEMLNLMKFTLDKAGFEVATCDSGRKAMQAIADAKPDLLILDMMLPGVDGYSLLGEIAAEPAMKDMRIIVATALESARILLDKFPQAVGFLPKPFSGEKLLETVQAAFAAAPKP